MKILYVTEQDLNSNNGIALKVKSQSEIWQHLGHEVTVINFNTLNVFGTHFSTSPAIKLPNSKLKSLLVTWIHSFKLFIALKNNPYDLIYTRGFLWSPFWSFIGFKFPIVCEINGDEDQELRNRSFLTFIYNKLSKPFKILSYKGLVCVSNELKIKYHNFGVPIRVIANSYKRMSDIAFAKDNKINIAFVGTDQSWHGRDKIEFLAKALTDFQFHMIGDFKIKFPSQNIHYYGSLSHDEVIEVLKNCDVGISSLALHRIPLHEASPLKSREYLSLGMPVIIAYIDTDLTNELPFVLSIPNTEKNIEENLNQIKKFCLKVKSEQKELSKEIKLFFNSRLSQDSKEEQRLKFFKEIIAHGTGKCVE